MSIRPVLLTSKHTIDDYKDMVKRMASDEIIDFVRLRFTERYLEPARPTCSCGSGFTTVAICCLLIEALESFYSGWPDTSGRGMSQLAFCQFFQRFPRFSPIYSYGPPFYRHIRCGILHQAETTDGWLIRRTGTMFDTAAKTLDPELFHQALADCLNDYCSTLKASDWHHGEVWQNFREKMKNICDNCNG